MEIAIIILAGTVTLLILVVGFQWARLTDQNNNREKEQMGIEGLVVELLSTKDFAGGFQAAMAEFVGTNKTDGPAFSALKEFYDRICATPVILKSAWSFFEECANAAKKEFSQHCLKVYMYGGGVIEVEMKPYTLTLYSSDGEELNEEAVVMAHTQEEIRQALNREGVATVSVSYPSGDKAFAGPVDLMRARLSEA